MSKKELTKKRICFVLYGYKIDVLTLFDKLLPFYEEKNYPLKSVDFDFFKDKGYKSESLPLEKFLEKEKLILVIIFLTIINFFIFLLQKGEESLSRGITRLIIMIALQT